MFSSILNGRCEKTWNSRLTSVEMSTTNKKLSHNFECWIDCNEFGWYDACRKNNNEEYQKADFHLIPHCCEWCALPVTHSPVSIIGMSTRTSGSKIRFVCLHKLYGDALRRFTSRTCCTEMCMYFRRQLTGCNIRNLNNWSTVSAAVPHKTVSINICCFRQQRFSEFKPNRKLFSFCNSTAIVRFMSSFQKI